MTIRFHNFKKTKGWYVFLIPTFIFGHFKYDNSIEFGVFWLLWGFGLHVEYKAQKGNF